MCSDFIKHCFVSVVNFKIICITPQFLVWHIRFNPFPDTLSDSSLHRSRLLLIIPESSSCSALMWLILYFPQQRALTQVETGAISPPCSYCICLFPSATSDHPGSNFSSSISIVHLYHWTSWGKSASHSFIYWRLCLSMHAITWVIFLPFILLQFWLSFSCLGPERVQRVH